MGARCRIDFAVAEEEAAHRLSCSSEVGLPPRRRLRRLESSRKGQARIGLSSVDFRVGLTSGNIVLRVGGIGDGEADLQGSVFGAVNNRVERIRIRRNAGSLVQGNSCFHGRFVITGGGIPSLWLERSSKEPQVVNSTFVPILLVTWPEKVALMSALSVT
jgi:hypothetical protein